MSAVEDLRLIEDARALGLLRRDGFTVTVGHRGSHLTYMVALVPRARRADGTLGRRWERPVYTGPRLTAEEAISYAAGWVRAHLREVNQ